MILLLYELFVSLTLVYLCSEFGEQVKSAFAEIEQAIYLCDWHLFANDIQKMLPTIIIVTQKPIVFHGIGIITATRQSFENVNKWN